MVRLVLDSSTISARRDRAGSARRRHSRATPAPAPSPRPPRARTRSDSEVGSGSRISTMTPRPASAIMRMAACSTPVAPAADIAEHVIEHIQRMHAHQHRLGAADVALHQRDMLGIGDAVDIDQHAEIAAMPAVERHFRHALDDAVMAPAIGDQVGDGADLQAVALGEGDQVVAPRHRAVVIHDLADHAGGDQARPAARYRRPPRYGRRAPARRLRAPSAETHGRA